MKGIAPNNFPALLLGLCSLVCMSISAFLWVIMVLVEFRAEEATGEFFGWFIGGAIFMVAAVVIALIAGGVNGDIEG